MFGVDIVLPDFSYIIANAHKLRAVVITHGHEDHIGALPYLMKQVKVPEVWATRFTSGLIKSKVDEHGLINATNWCEIVPDEPAIRIGSFELEFIRVSHSIPDCVAVAILTEHGTIVHTGDIKLDSSPLDGVQTDLPLFAELGSDGVDLYMGDSTNADVPGHTKSERSLSGPLRDIVARAPGRVIASCFSSHIHRLQQFTDIAQEHGRVVCLLGRSLNRNFNIARNLGYLDADSATIIKPQKIDEYDPSKVMVLCTGSQGEPLAAMNRIAWGSHPAIQPDALDTVIFSSRTIPGNEIRVHRLINQLSRLGAHIYHADIAQVHVSGHGCAEELKLLLQLVRPANFMPIHGEWRHLRAHSDLARMVGVDPASIIMGENGLVVELANGKARLTDELVPVGQRLVDRHSNEDILVEVMEDRQQASGDGMLVVVARVDPHESSQRLELISRGFMDDDRGVLDDALRAAEESLDDASGTHLETDRLQELMQAAVQDTVFERTRKNPLVVPVVLED
jgi:ribonuclease J